MDDSRRLSPPSRSIPSRHSGSIITLMRIGPQSLISKMGRSGAAATIGLLYFRSGPGPKTKPMRYPDIPSCAKESADTCGRRGNFRGIDK
jgi:hypothetical protein